MGVPFSQEVKTAVDVATDLATDLKSHATTALYALILISVIHTFLLAIFLLAIIALLITVNPDLVEERKAFVTPVVRWWLFPMRGWRGLGGIAEKVYGEKRREGAVEGESRSTNESFKSQRRRRASPR
ncbi:uncharacterized protein PAC_18867 [Phialocephala subalpina]|uniref:Uncharacterized protein n=1 Tax=Phialocephala subalpina TaxID=576137 RepID=A0A1L7XVA0_9HELO|nr:uncharacterized protein PAC_18867 [Phialocephala subalpina]